MQPATKFGNPCGAGGEFLGARSDPPYVRECCDASLKRLGVDVIDLNYQPGSIRRRRSRTRSGRWPTWKRRGRSATSACRRPPSDDPQGEGPPDCGVADGVFALESRRGRGGSTGRAGTRRRVRRLQPTRPRLPDGAVQDFRRSAARRLTPPRAAVPGRQFPKEPGTGGENRGNGRSEGLHAWSTRPRVVARPGR